MSTVTLEEAQAKLPDLVASLQPGESVLITRNNQPVARLLAEEKVQRKPRAPGNCQGMAAIVAEDEEHLRDFEDYTE